MGKNRKVIISFYLKEIKIGIIKSYDNNRDNSASNKIIDVINLLCENNIIIIRKIKTKGRFSIRIML